MLKACYNEKMKEWLKNNMKNELKFIIPNKFLVDLAFKDKLQLHKICELNDLIAINVDRIFNFTQMTDNELIDYYNYFGKLNRREKAIEISEAEFELYDIKYSYSYENNKLHLESKLFYKSPEELYDGKGKFIIDFHAVLKIPNKAHDDAVRFGNVKQSLDLAGETINLSHHPVVDVVKTCTVIDFNDPRCNKEMPGNVRIITDGSTTPKATVDTFDEVGESDKDDLYFE